MRSFGEAAVALNREIAGVMFDGWISEPMWEQCIWVVEGRESPVEGGCAQGAYALYVQHISGMKRKVVCKKTPRDRWRCKDFHV